MLTRLKLLRRERAMSQQQLAAQLGISQQSINKYENHNVEPDIAMLSQMADFFGTTIDYLVGRSDERTPPGKETPPGLSAREGRLLARYRRLNDSQTRSIDLVMENYLQDETE